MSAAVDLVVGDADDRPDADVLGDVQVVAGARADLETLGVVVPDREAERRADGDVGRDEVVRGGLDAEHPPAVVHLGEAGVHLAADDELALFAEALPERSGHGGSRRRRGRGILSARLRRQNEQRATNDGGRNGLRHHGGQEVPHHAEDRIPIHGCDQITSTSVWAAAYNRQPTLLQPAAEDEVEAVTRCRHRPTAETENDGPRPTNRCGTRWYRNGAKIPSVVVRAGSWSALT